MNNYLSIEIGNKNIKIVEGKRQGNNIIVSNTSLIKTPYSAVKDGNIINIEDLVISIDTVLKNKKIKTKKVIFNINTNSLISRNLDLPILKTKAETLSMIKYELEQYMPVALNEYNLLYKIIYKYEDDGIKKGKYIIYALSNKLFNDYIQIAEKLKLKLASIDLSFNNLDNIIKPKIQVNDRKIEKDDVVLLINLGHDTIVFNIINKGVSEFSRIINLGGRDIDISFEDYFNIDKESAVKFKHSLKTIEEDAKDSQDEILKKNMVKGNLDNWISQIKRLIQYYTSRNKDTLINKAYIYGGSSLIPNIDKYLSSQLGIKFELLDNITNIKIQENLRNDENFDIKFFLNTISGLYLDKKNINFLSDNIKNKKVKFNKFIVFFSFVLTVTAFILFYFYQYNTKVISMKNEIEELDKYLTSGTYIKSANEVDDMTKSLQLLNQYKNTALFISLNIAKEDFITTEVLDATAASVPIDTTIRSLVIDKNTIQILGESYSRESIAQFEKNLKDIEFISNVHIPAITVNTGERNDSAYTFSIICSVKDVNSDDIN